MCINLHLGRTIPEFSAGQNDLLNVKASAILVRDATDTLKIFHANCRHCDSLLFTLNYVTM